MENPSILVMGWPTGPGNDRTKRYFSNSNNLFLSSIEFCRASVLMKGKSEAVLMAPSKAIICSIVNPSNTSTKRS